VPVIGLEVRWWDAGEGSVLYRAQPKSNLVHISLN